MASKQVYTVGTIGIDENKSEMNVIQSVLIISQQRVPKFDFHESADKSSLPDIVIVNADTLGAVEKWHAFHLLHKDNKTISCVMIGNTKPEDAEAEYYLKRPLVATRLLALLEKVVTEKHGFEPALAFDGTLSGKEMPRTGAAGDITALVVDDSLPIRTQLKMALENMASKVDFADNGEDALELIKKNDYNLVFLDVILPGMDGYDLCKTIKHDPQKAKTQVIMLTSSSSPADRVKGKLAGCDTYLIKPVQLAVFEEVVQECLEVAGS